MSFRQLIQDDLGCASSLIGDEDAGVAAVVDPKVPYHDIDRIVEGIQPDQPIAIVCSSGQLSGSVQ